MSAKNHPLSKIIVTQFDLKNIWFNCQYTTYNFHEKKNPISIVAGCTLLVGLDTKGGE